MIIVTRELMAAAALFIGALLWVSTANAARTIYRCEKDGHITLTDTPCEGSLPADTSRTTLPFSGTPSTIGTWSGQLQYAGSEAGEMIAAAHSVVRLTLEFTADGKVSGLSPENECRWLGVWSQGGKGIERMISLDISLTECRYAGFVRRYSGTFLLAAPDVSGQVNLLAYTPPIPGQKVRGYTLKGTLRHQ